MKTFLFIFIFALSLKAEPLTAYNNTCIYNYTMSGNNIQLYPSLTTSYYTVTYSINVFNQLLINTGKYTLDSNGYCVPKTPINTLGLTNEQYNFMMALTGLLSSILLVSIIFKKV